MTEVVVTAVFTPTPGAKDQLIEALQRTMSAVHDEQGCQLYAIHDADDGTVTMIEKWDSVEDLDTHGSGEPVAALREAVAPYLAGEVAVTRMTAIPVGDASRGAL